MTLGAFGTATVYETGDDGYVSIGDFNADGIPDLAASSFGGTVSILLGQGNGSFNPSASYAAGAGARSLAIDDLNGDGKLDLVVTNSSAANTVSVLIGNGDGSFQPRVAYGTGDQPWSVATMDVNGDGRRDLVVTNRGANTVSLLAGNGDGTFQARVDYSVGASPSDVAIGDMNGDGRPDVVTANSVGFGGAPASVSILLSDGLGAFQAANTFSAGFAVTSVTLGDLNDDGLQDIVLTCLEPVSAGMPGAVQVLLNNGDGSFLSRSQSAGFRPSDSALADVNRDGVPDLVVANLSSRGMAVLLGIGDGTFQAPLILPSLASLSVAVADLNSDGLTDFVTSSLSGAGGNADGRVSVSLLHENGPLFRAPVFDPVRFGSSDDAGGWLNNDLYPRELADISGDGRADIVGFGNAGVYVALANSNGGFADQTFSKAMFGSSDSAGGWSSNDTYPRTLGDVNGDGRADIVGFGSEGVYVALSNGGSSFLAPTLNFGSFGASAAAGGWSSNSEYPRIVADVNGDGRDDLVGFGSAGVYVALANADASFQGPVLTLNSFGKSTAAGGWSDNDLYPRTSGDVNGDGRSDLIGFGESGVYVALANGSGGFDSPFLASDAFGHSAASGGWISNDKYPRLVADIDGDGAVDLVGFGGAGVYVASGNGDGTFDQMFALNSFGADAAAGGWSSNDLYPRVVADFTGDGRADIVGFGAIGVFTSPSIAFDLL